MNRRVLIIVISCLLTLEVYPQDIRTLQEAYLEAEYFFMKGDYADALYGYLRIAESLPDNANIAYKAGVCYLNIPGKKNLSIGYLEAAARNVGSRYKEGTVTQVTAPYDALYELGVAYRIGFQFDNAILSFSKYRETLLRDDTENIAFIDHEIKVCENARKMVAVPVQYISENIGGQFNDGKANFNPVFSADGNSFVYMVSEKFYDAVMFSAKVNGKWSSPVNITPDLKSDGDLYVSALSSDGKTLFLSRDDNYNSDLWSSTYNGTRWTEAVKLNKNINTKYWESHGFISADGKTLIFASDRPGGYGGLDLYISRMEKGGWGVAVNLGPEINTPFNEDRPSLVNNGKTIFFASQGHDNIGGYDLFRADKQTSGIWSKPANLGYPLNTPDDNIFFCPTEDGKSGYISIIKENEGFGGEDIYKITFKQ